MYCAIFRNRDSQRVMTAAVLIVACGLFVTPSQAQTFLLLHSFTGAEGGANPWAGVTLDRAGNIYGTTTNGGNEYGDVFKLSKVGSAWVVTPLHDFEGDTDGAGPYSTLRIGPDGGVYGTTQQGGITDNCCGTVFKLSPPATVCKTASCPWVETILYRFQAGNDGSRPYGGITLDQAGNIYGTTEAGGGTGCTGPGCGTVYKLTHSQGQWTESVLYRFDGDGDGTNPLSTVIVDQAGNLYGTTSAGGSAGFGAVYQLSPTGSGWSARILYSFQNGSDGRKPAGGLVMDATGNLFGDTYYGGSGSGGTVYELAPAGGNWTFNLLYSFTTHQGNGGPWATLVIDSGGSLYGTTYAAGVGDGSAFKLTPSNGRWIETDLVDFEHTNGSVSYGSVALDPTGNVYGVAFNGGSSRNCTGGCGVVWEVTQ
jgi:uncharacterized repeat protein (TIGR03803 family)